MTGNEKDEKLFLLTQEGCPHCVDEKKEIKKGPLNEHVKIIDLAAEGVMEQPAMKQIVEKLDIEGVPQMIAVDGNQACLMEKNDQGVYKKSSKCTLINKE